MSNKVIFSDLNRARRSEADEDLPYWWECDSGHLFRETITERHRRKCPVCIGKLVIPGVNDLATTHPHLLSEWDYHANMMRPDQITVRSAIGANWRCKDCQQLFHGTLYKRKGCPVCHGKKIVVGVNDLGTTYPEVAETISKNCDVSAEEVTARSQRRLLWECEYGHEWEATVANRTLGNGCRECNFFRVYEENRFSEIHPNLAREWSGKNTIYPDEVSQSSGKEILWECEDCSYEWMRTVKSRVESPGCPSCYTSGSLQEKSLRDFLRENLSEEQVRYNDRELISPKEVDIYYPNLKIAIEYNGCYWHTERQGKDRQYHSEKVRAARKKGVQLILVWEDDWRDKPEIIKEMLLRKMGKSTQRIIGARSMSFRELSYAEAAEFLNQHHIQGAVNATEYLGLVFEDDLKAVLALTERGEKTWEIVRYASSLRLPGGFSKLLKITEERIGSGTLYSFSDNSVSDGGMYEQTGFVRSRELPPDYTYLVGETRQHKFGYRKKRFKNDPNLLWREGLTERELAELNGLDRIWDSGKIRWERDF